MGAKKTKLYDILNEEKYFGGVYTLDERTKST